jgi:hypothetical protein
VDTPNRQRNEVGEASARNEVEINYHFEVMAVVDEVVEGEESPGRCADQQLNSPLATYLNFKIYINIQLEVELNTHHCCSNKRTAIT